MIRFLLLMLLFAASPASAEPFKKSDLIGTWIYQSAYTEFPDGSRVNQFGDHPKGIFIVLRNGIYSHIVMSDTLPKVKSGLLKETAPDEQEALAEGILAHFGTWQADEKSGTLTVTIKSSSFPNFDGISQTRIVTVLNRSRLEYVNLTTTSGVGAKVVAILRRAP